MRNLLIATALASGLALAACDYDQGDYNNAEYNADYNAEGVDYNGTAGGGYNTATNASGWPEGARIVEENGVVYRIDPSGARVRLETGDSRILVEDGTRFRVDPDGTRVRIDDEGAVIIDSDGAGPDATINTGDTSVSVNTQ